MALRISYFPVTNNGNNTMWIAWDTSPGDSWKSSTLVKSLLPFHVSEAPHIAQVKAEAVLILVTHRTECEAPIFHTDSAAIPVVARLHRAVLQKPNVSIEPHRACSAQAALVGSTVCQQDPKLMKVERARNIIGNQILSRDSEIYIGTSECDSP